MDQPIGLDSFMRPDRYPSTATIKSFRGIVITVITVRDRDKRITITAESVITFPSES